MGRIVGFGIAEDEKVAERMALDNLKYRLGKSEDEVTLDKSKVSYSSQDLANNMLRVTATYDY